MKLWRYVPILLILLAAAPEIYTAARARISAVSKEDVFHAAASRAGKCGVRNRDDVIDAAASRIAHHARPIVDEFSRSLMSLELVRAHRASVGDWYRAMMLYAKKELGNDSEQVAMQPAFRAAVSDFESDDEVCRYFGPQQAVTEAGASKAVQRQEVAPPDTDDAACHEVLSAEGAQTRWHQLNHSPTKYFQECAENYAEAAQQKGGLSADEAKQHADSVCTSLMEQERACMTQPGATPEKCFCAMAD